jgi:hypothetical protein
LPFEHSELNLGIHDPRPTLHDKSSKAHAAIAAALSERGTEAAGHRPWQAGTMSQLLARLAG